MNREALQTVRFRSLLPLVLAGAFASAAVPAIGQPIPPDSSLVEHLNPLLGPDYAQWLVGPIAEIASKEEQEEFLALTSDEDARRFIDEFWAKPEHQLIVDIYQRRAAEADDRFTEAQVAGRRTDRGSIYILYGEPAEVGIEEFRNVDDPDVIVWRYDRKQAGEGLDGRKPAKLYRFTRIGDMTRMFRRGGPLDPAERRRRDPRNRPFSGSRPPF